MGREDEIRDIRESLQNAEERIRELYEILFRTEDQKQIRELQRKIREAKAARERIAYFLDETMDRS